MSASDAIRQQPLCRRHHGCALAFWTCPLFKRAADRKRNGEVKVSSEKSMTPRNGNDRGWGHYHIVKGHCVRETRFVSSVLAVTYATNNCTTVQNRTFMLLLWCWPGRFAYNRKRFFLRGGTSFQGTEADPLEQQGYLTPTNILGFPLRLISANRVERNSHPVLIEELSTPNLLRNFSKRIVPNTAYFYLTKCPIFWSSLSFLLPAFWFCVTLPLIPGAGWPGWV